MKPNSEGIASKVEAKSSSPSPPHKRSRSRSRTPRSTSNKTRKVSKKYSRSKSYSSSPLSSGHSKRKHNRSVSRSASPGYWRRHLSSTSNIAKNSCLGVFGMSLSTTERTLEKEFIKFGKLQKVKVIRNLETGRSRGFAFVYFEDAEDARIARQAMNGKTEIDGHTIRIDYSIGRRGSSVKPRSYLGRSYYSPFHDRHERPRYSGYNGYYGKNRRSPAHYIRRHSFRGRSRSRSFSPRR